MWNTSRTVSGIWAKGEVAMSSVTSNAAATGCWNTPRADEAASPSVCHRWTLSSRRAKRERQDQEEPGVQRQARGGIADVAQEIRPSRRSRPGAHARAGRCAPPSRGPHARAAARPVPASR